MKEDLNKIIYNNEINDIIINNKNYMKEELNNTNNLEENISDVKDEYYIKLLLQYFRIKDINKDEILPTLIKKNICDFNSLIDMYPDFLDYISLCDRLSEYFLDYLDSEKKVNIDSPDTYEINKGEFDSAATESMTIVSKYAETMGLTPSMLYKIKDKVYRICEDGNLSIIPEGSTILMHNIYDIKDVLYVLLTLSGLDINVVIGAWGFKYHAKEHLENLKRILEMASILGLDKDSLSVSVPDEKDNIICSNITINTKKMKHNIDSLSILTNKDKNILYKFDKNFEPTESKTLRK